MHDLSVGRQDQPELQNDDRNLRRLGPEHRSNGRDRGLRTAESHQRRVHDAGGDVDDSPQKSGRMRSIGGLAEALIRIAFESDFRP